MLTGNTLELTNEQKHIDEIRSYLYGLIGQAFSNIADHDRSVKMLLADTWEELRLKPTALSPQDLEQLSLELDRFDARKQLNNDLLSRYKRMLVEPFFARVDFQEDCETRTERITIGLYNLKDKSGNILVHDWRAPVCSLYYEFEPGRAFYLCLDGKIEGEVKLKRQYKIENGILKYYVDTDISIDDNMLLDILSASPASHMRNIVSTIQKEQNTAIRHENAPVLSVVGTAGSGKTSVALHRASYLLYRFRDHLEAAQIRVFSPSASFSEYISRVLPDLGEENIDTCTIHDFLKNILKTDVESPFLQNEAATIERSPLRLESISLKTTEAFFQKLCAFCDEFTAKGPAFHDIKAGNRILFSASDLADMYSHEFSFLNPALRFIRIKKVAEKKLGSIERILTAKYSAAFSKKLCASDLKTAVKMAVSQAVSSIKREINEITSLTPADLYSVFLSEYPEIAELFKQRNDEQPVLWEDAPAIAYIALRLGYISPDRNIKQLIIDEAQDYSPVCLAAIHLYFPEASATILGDPYQRTLSGTSECDPGSWGKAFGYPRAHLLYLEKCYRSTAQITHLMNACLGKQDIIQACGRNGEDALISVFSIDTLKDKINIWKADGVASIAVLTRSFKEAKSISMKLEGSILAYDDAVILPGNGKIAVGSYHLFKGMEFDAVAVVWPDADIDASERRRLYTACSRALNRAALFTSKEMILKLGLES